MHRQRKRRWHDVPPAAISRLTELLNSELDQAGRLLLQAGVTLPENDRPALVTIDRGAVLIAFGVRADAVRLRAVQPADLVRVTWRLAQTGGES